MVFEDKIAGDWTADEDPELGAPPLLTWLLRPALPATTAAAFSGPELGDELLGLLLLAEDMNFEIALALLFTAPLLGFKLLLLELLEVEEEDDKCC